MIYLVSVLVICSVRVVSSTLVASLCHQLWKVSTAVWFWSKASCWWLSVNFLQIQIDVIGSTRAYPVFFLRYGVCLDSSSSPASLQSRNDVAPVFFCFPGPPLLPFSCNSEPWRPPPVFTLPLFWLASLPRTLHSFYFNSSLPSADLPFCRLPFKTHHLSSPPHHS